MQSGKSTKKTKNSNIESAASPEAIDALEAPKTVKRAAKPLATPALAKESTISKPKSLSSKSRITSSERPTRSTSHHRAAKSAPVAAEPTKEAPLTLAAAAGAVQAAKAVINTAAPRRFTQDDVAKLAYSYWLARGQQGGNPYDDWIRAEHELRSRK